VKHISKPITFLLHELAGSIKSHFVARVLLHLSFIETDFQPCVLLKKNLLYKSSQDFWPVLGTVRFFIRTEPNRTEPIGSVCNFSKFYRFRFGSVFELFGFGSVRFGAMKTEN
jgi:hypothetical protein